VDCTDMMDRTPLMMAVESGHVESTVYLIRNNAIVNARDTDGRTALHRGAANGHEDCVDELIRHGADLTLRDNTGRTALHMASMCGHMALLSLLLESGPLESQEDNRGYTPLHYCCYNGHDSCMEVLLEKEELKKFSGNKFSPLHCAVINGNDSCTELLLDCLGLSVLDQQDARGRSALHAAAFSDQGESMALLLSHKAKVNIADSVGKTPIMYAAGNGHVAAVELLLEQGADLTVSDRDRNTALHHACFHKREDIALLLLDKIDDSITINMANIELQTPLHIAARNGLVPVVQDLIGKGGSVLALDDNGYSPALACAPTPRVADCLAIILAHMPLTPTPNHVTANKAHRFSQPPQAYGQKSSTYAQGEGLSQDSQDVSQETREQHNGSLQSSDSEFY